MAPAAPAASLQRHDFAGPQALADGLAGAVADDLRAAIARCGAASLALSGGRTPARFFAALARQGLAWDKVTVTLVDERWVPPSHARSNETLLREGLLQGPAAAARFLGLVTDAESPEAGLAAVTARLAALPRPLDAVVLGLGGDGHTASFFPGGDALAAALDPAGESPVLPLRASGAGEPRITLTLPLILEAGRVYLHIEGPDKAAVLAEALRDGPVEALPVRAVLRARPVDVYWCP